MRLWQIKIIVSFFIFNVLCINQNIALNAVYWSSNVLLVFAFVVDFKTNETFYLRNNTYAKQMTILFILAFVSLLWTPNLTGGLNSIARLFFNIVNSLILYYFFVKYRLVDLLVFQVLLYSAINYTFIFGLGTFEVLAAEPDSPEWIGRMMGIEGSPNPLAAKIAFSLFLSLFVLNGRVKGGITKYLHIVNIPFALYTTFLTASRKGMIACFVLLAFYLVLHFSWSKVSIRQLIFIAVGGIGLLLLIKNEDFIDDLGMSLKRFEVMSTLFDSDKEVDSSLATRVSFFKIGWEGFLNSPIVGYGINSFRHHVGRPPHNNYIELLYGMGFLGPLIYYAFHYSLLRRLLKYRLGALIAVFVVIIMIMDTADTSAFNKNYMLMLTTLSVLADMLIANRVGLEKQNH